MHSCLHLRRGDVEAARARAQQLLGLPYHAVEEDSDLYGLDCAACNAKVGHHRLQEPGRQIRIPSVPPGLLESVMADLGIARGAVQAEHFVGGA